MPGEHDEQPGDTATAPHHLPEPPTTARGSRVAALAKLLYPGIITICLCIPSLIPGALVFDIRDDFTLSAAEIGAGVSGFYLLSFVAAQLALPLSERLGPLVVARIGLLLSASGVLLAAGTGSKAGLAWMCVLAGFGNGIATPSANVLIALTVAPRRQGLAFGLRVSALPAATAFTAAGASFVAHDALGWRALVMGVAVVLLAVLAASYLQRSPRLESQDRKKDARDRGVTSLRILALGGLLAATACSTLSPFLVESLMAGGVEPGRAALLLSISAWIGVVARILVGIAADWYPYPLRHLGVASLVLMVTALGMGLLAFGRGTPVLATASLLTFGIGWVWPGLLHHAAIVLHPGHMARATTQLQMGTWMGALAGPLAFGLLVQLGSFELAWSVMATGAALGGVMVLLGTRHLERRRRLAEQPAAGEPL